MRITTFRNVIGADSQQTECVQST